MSLVIVHDDDMATQRGEPEFIFLLRVRDRPLLTKH